MDFSLLYAGLGNCWHYPHLKRLLISQVLSFLLSFPMFLLCCSCGCVGSCIQQTEVYFRSASEGEEERREKNTFLSLHVAEHEEYGRLLIYESCPPPLSSCSGFVPCHAVFEHLRKPQMLDFDSYTEADLILIPYARAFWLRLPWRKPCSKLPFNWGGTFLVHVRSGTWSSAVLRPLPVFKPGDWVLAVDMRFTQNYDHFLWTPK